MTESTVRQIEQLEPLLQASPLKRLKVAKRKV
jgi:hypothetical protein